MRMKLKNLLQALTIDRVLLLIGTFFLFLYLSSEMTLLFLPTRRVAPIVHALILLLTCTILYCGACLHLLRTRSTLVLRGAFYVFLVLSLYLVLYVTLLDYSLGRSGDFLFNEFGEILFSEQRGLYVEWFVNLIPLQSIYTVYIKGLIDGNITLFYGLLNLFGNLCLFMPTSLLLSILFRCQRKWYIFLPTVALCSATIEALQFTFMVGSCDIDDVILNTLGALLLFLLLKIPFFKRICRALLPDSLPK